MDYNKDEYTTAADWLLHLVHCSQCSDAHKAESVMSRGCTQGRAIWLNWRTACKANAQGHTS